MWTTIYTRDDFSQDILLHDTWVEAVSMARQFRDYPEILKTCIYDAEGNLIATFTNYGNGSDKSLL